MSAKSSLVNNKPDGSNPIVGYKQFVKKHASFNPQWVMPD
jgi:hypothetical protein